MTDRIYRLWLLARCLLAYVRRGPATRLASQPKTVVVMLTGKLGDIVCGTPVLRALRKHLPHTRIVAAGGAVLAPLLAHSGLVDEYLASEGRGSAARVRAVGADAAVITGPGFTPAALWYLAGIPLVVVPRVEGGYAPGARTLPYRILSRLVATYPYRMHAYAPRERLRALEPLGVFEDDTRKHLQFSEAAAREVAGFFRNHGVDPACDCIVGISPTAGHAIKEWPAERFAAVADHIIERYGAKVLITGGAADRATCEAMHSHMRHGEGAVDASGAFDLDTLKAAIARLTLFISVDSGPLYIAEAFDVPTVDITGPIDEREQPPRGPLHVNVVPGERARPELFVLNARSYHYEEARRQVLSISVEQVVGAVDELMAALLPRP